MVMLFWIACKNKNNSLADIQYKGRRLHFHTLVDPTMNILTPLNVQHAVAISVWVSWVKFHWSLVRLGQFWLKVKGVFSAGAQS